MQSCLGEKDCLCWAKILRGENNPIFTKQNIGAAAAVPLVTAFALHTLVNSNYTVAISAQLMSIFAALHMTHAHD